MYGFDGGWSQASLLCVKTHGSYVFWLNVCVFILLSWPRQKDNLIYIKHIVLYARYIWW